MSPSKLQERDVTRVAINGPHSPSLRTNKDSHAIQKPLLSNAPSSKNQKPTTAKRQPVIIYTHSPKIIHAQARDFMALVQKLTGFTRSDEDEDEKTSKSEPNKDIIVNESNINHNDVVYEDNEPSSTLITQENHNYQPPENIFPDNQYMTAAMSADVPFFPSSSHLLYEPAIFGNDISSPASFMDFTKGFGDY